MLKKVISGGQTGVDRIGLEVARSLGIKTGGSAPKDFRTENGVDLTLKDFGLVETTHSSYNYRTFINVASSDATVLFGDMSSAGSKLTLDYLKNKKYIVNPTVDQLIDFIVENKVETLNVAGNRASKLKHSDVNTITYILRKAFEQFKP